MSTEQAAELPVVAWRHKRGFGFDHWVYTETFHGHSEEALTYHATATAQIAALRAELEKAREDARRYNWIRHRVGGSRDSRGIEEFDLPLVRPCVASIMQGSVAQHFDCAIDAALSTDQAERKV